MKARLLSYTPSKTILGDTHISAEEVLPHLSYTFAVEGISRACSHQLIRHRLASYSQQSQRYVPVKDLVSQTVVPPSVTGKNFENFVGFIGQSSRVYESLVESSVPREDARFVLPNAVETNLLLTMDGGALFHFFGLRCCSRAQWEVRLLADMMLKEARLTTVWRYVNTYPTAVNLIAAGQVDLHPLITHRYPFAQLPEAIEFATAGHPGAIKTMVDFPG